MKKIIALVLALTMVLGLVAVAGAEDLLKIGYVQVGHESDWRMANTQNYFDVYTPEAGFELELIDCDNDHARQLQEVRNFITKDFDYIVIDPIQEAGWDDVLNEAKKAGIPVILMDRMIETQDDSLYTAYVGADFYAEGRRAGEYLIRKADALGKTQMRIVEICGTADSTPMRDRQQGFMDVINQDSRFTVIDSVDGDFLRSKGEECMRDLLAKYGSDGFDVVYSHNDSMTLGVLDVLADTENAPKDLILITVDGEKEAVDALKAGRINCVVQCTPNLGTSVMKLVKDLKEGKEVPKVYHPDEGAFTDFDNLNDPQVEGF
jgi:simple sugar transport system substrate-binding protein